MSDNWILPQTYRLVAEMEALKVRAMGMYSTNNARITQGDSPVYEVRQFEDITQELYQISNEIRNILP